MPSKQSEAVVRHWATARLTSQLPVAEQPDRETADHAWAGLTSEPREVDYLSVSEVPDAIQRMAAWVRPVLDREP